MHEQHTSDQHADANRGLVHRRSALVEHRSTSTSFSLPSLWVKAASLWQWLQMALSFSTCMPEAEMYRSANNQKLTGKHLQNLLRV